MVVYIGLVAAVVVEALHNLSIFIIIHVIVPLCSQRFTWPCNLSFSAGKYFV